MTQARDKANIPVLNFASKGIDDNADATAITISSGEVVSIGTTSSSGGYKVKVAGSLAPLEIARTTGDTIERSHLGMLREGTTVGQFKSDATNLWLEASAGALIINTGGSSERMRILSDGKVGIGTSDPKEKLDSRGASVISGDHATATNAYGTAHGILLSSTPNLGKITAISNGANDVKLELRGLDGGTANSNQLVLDGGTNRVGIGTSSPDTTLDVTSSATPTVIIQSSATTSQDAILKIKGCRTGAVTNNCQIIFETNDSASGSEHLGFITAGKASNSNASLLAFGTTSSNGGTSTEKMRIDSSGKVLLNRTSTNENTIMDIKHVSYGLVLDKSNNTGTGYHVMFSRDGGTKGNITSTTSAVQYNTSSDYRLKENVDYNFDATTRIKQLKPARFNFIADADTIVDGFLAHEVSDAVPEAISGEKDATETKEKVVVNANGNVIAENIEQADWETGKIADEDGNTKYPTDSTWEATKVVPVYQGIDQSKLVPLLVKTIQELEARITALETTTP